MKVNEAHDHAVYGKIKVLHYFRFAAEGLIFFLLISTSHILGKLCRNLVKNVIHVINFSNVQNVLRTSAMYVMSSARIFVWEGGCFKESCLGCQDQQSIPSRQYFIKLTVNFKGTISVLFISWFLFFSWLRPFYPSRFVSKPSLNHVSIIECSQIRKRCRNARIIVVSLVHGFLTVLFYDPFQKSFFMGPLRPVTRGRRRANPPWKLFPLSGKMCWT